MRRWLVALTLLLAIADADLAARRPRDFVGKRITGKVVGVIDGDTVDLLIAPKKTLRVRLHGIDTPERGELPNDRENYRRAGRIAEGPGELPKDRLTD